MIDPTNPNPAFYSEQNQNSPFRFVRISNSKYDWTKTLENKCCICGTVEIDDGSAVSFTHPSRIPSIYCGDCYAADEGIVHCDGCKQEIDGDDIYDIYEVPDDFDLPASMTHYGAICVTCMDDSDETEEEPINTPKKETTVKNDIKDTLNRIEDKIDGITDYLEGRRALYNDYYMNEITEAELDAGLRRLWARLKEV